MNKGDQSAAPTTEQFGLNFPREWNEMHRRIYAARHKRGNVTQFEHRKWIIERLWQPQVYEMNPWSKTRLMSTCEHSFVTWMSGGGNGKTTDAAACALEYWLEDPANTAVIVCSTTKEMLRRRIWGQITQLWHALSPDIFGTGHPTYKGEMLDTSCMIRWKPNDMKNGIFGVAVADGPVEDSINNLIGIHTTRVWLILDEMQGVNEAIMGALPNMVKNPESRFLGMGNPTSIMSMLCKYSEPKGGWNTVVRGETPDWEIDEGPYMGTGRAFFFDGRKSPAVLDPEWGKAHPWMTSKEQVDKHIAKKGMNSPEVWTQTIGWPPPLGTDNTVLDVAIIEKFRCREKAYWTSGYQQGASLDPAFVDGGDSKILQFFKFGLVNDDQGNRWVIEFGEWLEVPIDSGSDEPVEYQIVKYCRERCESKGIRPVEFGLDMTGIGRGLAMIFRQEWGPVQAVEFGGGPSDMLVDDDGKTAKQVFDRRSSELLIMLRNFAKANGIRGLPEVAEKELCMRTTTHKIKHEVETKGKFKKRLGKSPDNSDALAIAVDLARRNGAVPGDTVAIVARTSEDTKRKLVEVDTRFDEGNYAQSEDWSSFASGL